MDTSLLAARTVFRDRSRTLIWDQTAAQNEREAEEEFGFHGLSQSGPFFAFVRAMSNFNGN
jgi:hypothetical protein